MRKRKRKKITFDVSDTREASHGHLHCLQKLKMTTSRHNLRMVF